MASRRVVITGLGIISGLGQSVDEFWDNLREGRSGIRKLTSVDCSELRFNRGGEVEGYDPTAHFEPRHADLLDRFAQFALIAARQAVRDAGLEGHPALQRAAVVTGVALGGQTTAERLFENLYVDGNSRAHPFSVPRIMANAGASHISMEMGAQGPALTMATACASASHAIGQAFWMVRSGVVDIAITGGSEAPFALGHLKAWEAMRVVSPDTCQPFSKDRRGMILAEGGAMLILESLDSATARGATIYAELAGAGMSADAHHLTQPCPEGPARAMAAALDDAGVAPERLGYINAHGTGTPANDPTETRAIRLVCGEHADSVAVSSTKSMHGHALGASGGIEAVATVLGLHHQILPPTMNFSEPDPECDLDFIPNEARPADVEYALSNSFAFGGLNAVIALRRWDG